MGNKESEFKQVFRVYRKSKLAVAALVVAILLMVIAIIGPSIAPHDPIEVNLDATFETGFWTGNMEHPLGTDNLGRDIYSRLLYGTGISLRIGYAIIAITAICGLLIGLVSGYFGGIIDIVVMRFIDILLAFPPLLLALVIAATLGTGMEKAMLAIAIIYIPSLARIVRGSVLTVKELPYVEASRAMGGGNAWIIIGHVLPNIVTPVIVYLTLLLGDAILYTAALGFLGVGIDPSTPEWGAMLSGGRDFLLLGKWWITVFPGVMIFLAVLSFNLFGDGLREAVDSKLRL
jgi:ABC-type dipeptide/oligopeptide/nickel transport system permease subunit